MLRKGIITVILIGFAVMLLQLFLSFNGNEDLNTTALHYAENGIEEVGAANLVTSVVVTYRGLDTLGEVTILFLTAAIIGLFLKLTREEKSEKREVRPTSEILQTAMKVLVPVIFLFGIYVFINGHLTPGGGFQGGAIIASGILLMFLADPNRKISHGLIAVIESISGISFVIIGILGIVLAGGFLDNHILPLGKFGTLLSAGAVPLIYIFVGLKVGSELSNIIYYLNQTQKEKK
ncbi:MAG: sodium:proton antiporter [Marinilabiliales bacterium]|nr:MAG: sodium:proton antiporter [Marinilabiliales bacterium]